MTSPQEQAERIVREWDRIDGDRIVSDAVKDFGAAVDELLNLGRKLAKAEEK